MRNAGLNFFLVGCERSGTTLLRLMLNEHPSITIPPESHFIADLLDRFNIDQKLSSEELREAYSILVNLKRWKEWNNSKDELWSMLINLSSPNITQVINCAFELKLDGTGKQLWGDKTPKYCNYIDKLEVMYPEAKFIHLTRDGRDVCLSFLKTGWVGPWISIIAQFWSTRVEAATASQNIINRDRYLEIRYEDIVLNTEQSLSRICSFLNEDYSPSMLDYSASFEKKLAGREVKFHQKLKRKPKAQDINRWTRELKWWQVLTFESFASSELKQCNYQCKYKHSGYILYPLTRGIINSLTKTAKVRRYLGLNYSRKG